MKPKIRFRWLDVAGIEIKFTDKTLLIDPFLTRPKWTNLFTGKVSPDKLSLKKHIKHCDYLLITHPHFDHVLDAPEIAKATGATVFGSENTCRIMRLNNIAPNQLHQVTENQILKFPDFQIKVIGANHRPIPFFHPDTLKINSFPAKLADYKMDTTFSFLITIAGRKIMNWASFNSVPKEPTDILFIVPEGSSSFFAALIGVFCQ